MKDRLRKLIRGKRDDSAKGHKSGNTSALNATETEPQSSATDGPSTSYSLRDESPQVPSDFDIESSAAPAKLSTIASESTGINLPESLWNQAYEEIIRSGDKHLKIPAFSQSNEDSVDNSKDFADFANFESGSDVSNICKQVIDVANDKRNSISDAKSTGRIPNLYGNIIGSVQKFIQVGDIVAQVDPIHVGLPWAGIRFVLQMAVNDSEEYLAVLEGTDRIAKLIYRYSIFENVYLRHADSARGKAKEGLEKALRKMYKAILSYLFKAKRYYSQTVSQRLRKSLIPTGGFQRLFKEINELEAEVQENARLFAGESTDPIYIQHLFEGSTLICDITDDNSRFLELRKILGAYDDHLKYETRETILNWVSLISYGAHHRDIYDKVMENSGKWFFERKEFVKWHSMTTSSLLWLRGDAGSGKSYLTSLVVKDLLRPHLETKTALAFFYCSRTSGQSERQEPRGILCSILRQLSSPLPGLPLKSPVIAKYEQDKLEASPPAPLSLKECKKLIEKLIRDEYSSVTIVIDALDECISQERGDLFHFLGDLLKCQGTVVKIFVSSRNEPDISEVFRDSENLYIEASHNAEDIKNFVEHEVDTRLLGGKAEDDLKELVKKTLCEKAHGVFRWVALQLDAICDPEFVYSADDVKHELHKLPETLRETYARTFENISKYPPDSREVTERVLKWSMCAQRLLSTQEFLAAVSMNSDGRFVPRTKQKILGMCKSLLVIDEKLDTFRLSHLSVKEYIEDSKPQYGEIQMHTTAAETCLSFLDCGNKNLRNDFKAEGFYKYAVIYWADHCYKAAQNRNEGRLGDLFRSFALVPEVSISFKEWLCTVQSLRSDWDLRFLAYWQGKRLRSSFCNPPSVFFAGCAFNFPEVIEVASMGKSDIIRRNWFGQTGLHIACLYGSDEIAQRLVKRGVDVEVTDDEGNVALCAALENGNLEIIRMLMSSINSFQIDENHLSAVARNRRNSKDVLELLLSQDEIKSREDRLMFAILHGLDHGVVELLLDQDGDIEITPEMLEAAARRSADGKTLELLLNRGHNIRITEELIIAAAKNRQSGEEALKVLLDRNRNIQITEKMIIAAAGNERFGEVAMKELLDRDRDIQITENMMVAAARNFVKCEAMINLLLDRDQEIQITENLIRTAVSYSHDQKALELLLNRSAATQITEEILVMLAGYRYSDISIFKSLLDRDRNIQITERILIAAARSGKLKNMQLLLSSDKEIQITEEVLAAAVEYPQNDMLELLLNREGTRITERIFKRAVSRANKETMHLLLSREGELQVTQDILEAAVGNFVAMELLLSRDQEIQITEKIVEEAARNVWSGGKEMMQILLSRNEEIQITEKIFEAAVENPNPRVMQYLLDSNPKIEITETILEIVVGTLSRREKLERILAQGKKIRVTENVLKAAASLDESNIMELLLDADVEAQITEEVLKITRVESMRLLLNQHREIHITEEVVKKAVGVRYGGSMIHLWRSREVEFPVTQNILEAAAGNFEAMKLLLSRDPEIQITETIVKAAARYSWRDEKKMMQLLLSRNEEIQITEEIVEVAAKYSNLKVMQLLLDSNPKIEITEKIVEAAVLISGREKIEYLLRRDKKIQVTENVLKAAAGSYDSGSVVQLLLSLNQKILVSDAVLQAAATSGNKKALDLLWERSEKSADYAFFMSIANLCYAVKNKDEDLVQRLLLDGVAPNWKDSYGRTPLFWAVIYTNRSMVLMLLEAGANPLEPDNDGETPLSLATKYRYKEIINIIQEHQLAQNQSLEPKVQELDE